MCSAKESGGGGLYLQLPRVRMGNDVLNCSELMCVRDQFSEDGDLCDLREGQGGKRIEGVCRMLESRSRRGICERCAQASASEIRITP